MKYNSIMCIRSDTHLFNCHTPDEKILLIENCITNKGIMLLFQIKSMHLELGQYKNDSIQLRKIKFCNCRASSSPKMVREKARQFQTSNIF